jgi:spore germination cell wall hydrolase CwlJ-like protein
MKLKYLIFKIVFILLVLACLAICTLVNLADAVQIEPEPSEPLPSVEEMQRESPLEPTSIPSVEPSPEPSPQYIPNPDDVVMLAKLIYGEARGIKSITEQAAVVWCVLNRVDSSGYGM